jgi:hypothetical protein
VFKSVSSPLNILISNVVYYYGLPDRGTRLYDRVNKRMITSRLCSFQIYMS